MMCFILHYWVVLFLSMRYYCLLSLLDLVVWALAIQWIATASLMFSSLCEGASVLANTILGAVNFC